MSRSQRVILSALTLVLATMSLVGSAQTSLRLKVTDSQQNSATESLSIMIDSGHSNSVLRGTYAFTFNGYDENGNWFVLAGSIVADGNGNITGGELDINDAKLGVAYGTIPAGTYTISSNGLGSISLNTTIGPILVGVAASTPEDMRVISLNQVGSNKAWGSGVVRQQNPSEFNFPALAGNVAFGFQGFDSKGHPFATAGTAQTDASGNITNGEEDVNDSGTITNYTFTGKATSGIDANGRFTRQIYRNGLTFNQAVYVVSAGEEFYVQIDAGLSLYTAVRLPQSGAPFNNGSLNAVSVYRGAGQTKNATGDAVVGILGPDGKGNVTVTGDENQNGTIFHQVQINGTYAVAANGRTPVTLNDEETLVCYLAAPNEGFCINGGKGAGTVFFEPQAGGPFSNGYFSGEFLGGTLPLYVSALFNQIDSNFADGIGRFISTYTQSGPNGTQQNHTFKGTYAVDSTGGITISEGGNPIYYGYVVSSNEAVLISLDDNPRTSVEIKCRRRGSWIPRCAQ